MGARSIEAYERAAAELSAVVSRLATQTADAQKQQTALLQEQVERLESEFQERVRRFEGEQERRRAELDKEREELAGQRAELDLRDAQVVRRATHDTLKTLIRENENKELSPATQDKRRFIHTVCIVAMLFGTGVILASLIRIWWDPNTVSVWILSPISVGAVLAGGTLIFYLRWMNSWFDQHAKAEFRSRKRPWMLSGRSGLQNFCSSGQPRTKTSCLKPFLIV
jgi:hypothetical protein